ADRGSPVTGDAVASGDVSGDATVASGGVALPSICAKPAASGHARTTFQVAGAVSDPAVHHSDAGDSAAMASLSNLSIHADCRSGQQSDGWRQSVATARRGGVAGAGSARTRRSRASG